MRGRAGGFTLVELIAVMILVGILGGVAASRFFERKTFDAVAFADQARSLLRYGQKVAIAQNRPVYVRLNGASVALCFDSACATHVSGAAGNSNSSATVAACSGNTSWACEGMPSGISYTVTPSATAFSFNALGRPYASADTPTSLTSTFAQSTVRVSGDGSNYDIVVEMETGYVH